MNKDELRIRIIPEDGQVLIETHTDGIVKCKEIQEDALLDCIKNSAMRDYVNSGLLPSDCIHVKIHPTGNKEYCLWYPRLYADISYHETAYPNFPLPRLPQYKTPHALASLPTFLLSIPNGDHSFNALNNKLGMQYRDLLEHLKGKDPSYYYSDVLIPNGKTLKDFIGG